MADYFAEHNCDPLPEGQAPNHLLHYARLLYDTGLLNLDQAFPDKPRPPASKAVVEGLERLPLSLAVGKSDVQQCPVCVMQFGHEEERNDQQLVKLPCKHLFHADCILPWLAKTCTCPVCRFELPTDDADYEDYKRRKAREEDRKKDIEDLHNAMFS